MATTSTIGVARQALVDALDSGALAGKVHYSWQGSHMEQNEVAWVHDVTEWTQTIPNIKAGRVQRQESYTFEVVIWVAQPQGSADTAKTTFDRALALAAVAENALADDTDLGAAGVQWLVLENREGPHLTPLDKGWGCEIVLSVNGSARLT